MWKSGYKHLFFWLFTILFFSIFLFFWHQTFPKVKKIIITSLVLRMKTYWQYSTNYSKKNFSLKLFSCLKAEKNKFNEKVQVFIYVKFDIFFFFWHKILVSGIKLNKMWRKKNQFPFPLANKRVFYIISFNTMILI